MWPVSSFHELIMQLKAVVKSKWCQEHTRVLSFQLYSG